MILVADSGSTKTSWVDVESGNKIVTEGLNPHFTTDEQFLAACKKVLETCHSTSLQQVLFYGAGCGSKVQRERVKIILSEAFGVDDVQVETDMLGACRAVCGDKASLVGILGTGSNARYYDGERIKCQPTSTGYVLGDKGSANHVGRVLLNDYLTHRMPAALRRMFHETYHLSDAKLMDAVYHQPHPNRFLASLAPFAVQHQEEEYCGGVIWETLCDWYFDPLLPLRRRARYWEGTLHVVGGYAKAIEPTLRRYFEDDGLQVGTVVADPTEGLLRYHKTV